MSNQLTEEQIADLKASFDMFDKDGSGSISHDEIKQVMRRFGQRLSDSQIREIIKEVDINNDGEIDFEEFKHLMKSRDLTHDPNYEFRMAFDMIDTNGNGTISIKELRDLMKRVNMYLDDEEISAIMNEFDVDGNAELDFDEFMRLMV